MTAWCDEALELHLRQIGDLLRRNERFWRPQAFTYLQMPWEAEHAQLARTLRALPLQQAERIAGHDDALTNYLRDFIADADALAQAVALPRFEPQQGAAPAGAARDVPGRKWQQICEFAAALPADAAAVLEWCAGKAHLGRLLARERSCRVSALEWNAGLIAEGRRLALRENLPVVFHRVDVMSAAALPHLDREQCAVALHACGDLHLQLLRGAAARRPAALLLAPCCYQLTQADEYRPLSQAGARDGLKLSRDDLRTAVQGTVTSPLRVQRQRKQLQAWRLGFDLLQRELRSSADYLPLPSLPLGILAEGFPAFCRRAAAQKNLQLPGQLDYAHYEMAGWERLRQVTALDLPRLLFRRALELWLALDRALFLREAGYGVELGIFCERALTPRNLLIRARRRTA